MNIPIRQQIIVTSHGSLAVEESGQGGIPVLLIHGNFPQSDAGSDREKSSPYRFRFAGARAVQQRDRSHAFRGCGATSLALHCCNMRNDILRSLTMYRLWRHKDSTGTPRERYNLTCSISILALRRRTCMGSVRAECRNMGFEKANGALSFVARRRAWLRVMNLSNIRRTEKNGFAESK